MNKKRKFGCIDNNRVVGPWMLLHDNAWKVPVWVRKGPTGFKNILNDEVAYVTCCEGAIPYGNFGACAPDGMSETSGHIWGDCDGSMTADQHFREIKSRLDEELESYGWIVPNSLAPRRVPWYKRLLTWLR